MWDGTTEWERHSHYSFFEWVKLLLLFGSFSMHRLRRLKWCRKEKESACMTGIRWQEGRTHKFFFAPSNPEQKYTVWDYCFFAATFQTEEDKPQVTSIWTPFCNSKVRVTTLFSSHLTSLKLQDKISTVTFENTTSEESCCVSEQHSCMKREGNTSEWGDGIENWHPHFLCLKLRRDEQEEREVRSSKSDWRTKLGQRKKEMGKVKPCFVLKGWEKVR